MMQAGSPKKRILIVDDHPSVRLGLAQLITNEPDLEVCGEAATKAEAVEAVAAGKPDLILLDISLQDGSMAGLDLIVELRTRFGPMPILVLSMHDESLYAARAVHAGAMGYLMKQEPVRQVIVAVRRILSGGLFLSDEVTQELILNQIRKDKPAPRGDPATCLTKREHLVFRQIGKGMPPRRIAELLGLSVKTIESHRLNIRRKLSLRNAAELAAFAVKWVRDNK
jgi:DNA-binding NarL/FixJ family response regulator